MSVLYNLNSFLRHSTLKVKVFDRGILKKLQLPIKKQISFEWTAKLDLIHAYSLDCQWVRTF